MSKLKLSDAFINPLERIQPTLKKIENGVESICFSGFDNIDRYILGRGGFRESELTVLTGNSGSGKTQLYQDIALKCASNGTKSCLISLEFSADKVLENLAWQLGGIDPNDERSFSKIMSILPRAYEWIQKNGIYVYQASMLGDGLKFDDILYCMEGLYKLKGVRMFFLDPLTAFIENKINPAEDIDPIAKKLKKFIETHKAHVVVVMHARKTRDHEVVTKEDIYGSNLLGIYAHNIWSLWRYKEDLNAKTKAKVTKEYKKSTFLYCLKNREYGDLVDNRATFKFVPESRRFLQSRVFKQKFGENMDCVTIEEPRYIDELGFDECMNKKKSKKAIEEEMN